MMFPVISALPAFVTGLFRSRASLCLEHLADPGSYVGSAVSRLPTPL
jgi:hypothetical protein